MKPLRLAFGALILLQLHSAFAADPLDSWAWRNPLPTGHRVVTVHFGGGRFVATDGSDILVSADATNWSAHSTSARSLQKIAFGDGRYVAISGAIPGPSSIYTSTDATNWVSVPAGTTNALYAVAFGNGTFIAVGENQTIVSSPDGTNWTERRNVPLSARLLDVAYGNGMFLAVSANNGVPLSSPDGVTWTDLPSFGDWFNRVIFGNGVFLAQNLQQSGFSSVPRIVTTVNGTSWSVSPLYPAPAGMTPIHDGTRFVMLATSFDVTSNLVYTSSNGIDWTTNYFPDAADEWPAGLAYGNGQYVSLFADTTRTRLVRSTDLFNWVGIGTKLPITSATVFLRGGGKYVLAGGGPILVSTNGIDFETNSTAGNFGVGVYGSNVFILTTGGGSIVTSTNATNWTARSTGGSSINALAYGSNTFVAVGNAGDIRVSPAGTTWSGRFSGVTVDLLGIAYGNGVYAAVGAGGAVLTSSDTVNWTIQDLGTIATLRCIGFAKGRFFAGGDNGVIVTSTDGVTWTHANSGTTATLSFFATVRGNMLMAGSGALVTTFDGVQWRSRRVPMSLGGVGVTESTFMLLSGYGAWMLESGEVSSLALLTPYCDATGFLAMAVGHEGAIARLQKSTDMLQWTDVMTFTNTGALIPVGDTNATHTGLRFYRLVSP